MVSSFKYQRYLIVLFNRYLGSGNSFTNISEKYFLGWSTIGYIVRQVCQVIRSVIREKTISHNISEDKWYKIADSSQKRKHPSHCICAINGKHIWVISPYHPASLFFNYKKFFSIVLLAVALLFHHLLEPVEKMPILQSFNSSVSL